MGIMPQSFFIDFLEGVGTIHRIGSVLIFLAGIMLDAIEEKSGPVAGWEVEDSALKHSSSTVCRPIGL